MIKEITNQEFTTYVNDCKNNYRTVESNLEWLEYFKENKNIDYKLYLFNEKVIFIILRKKLYTGNNKILTKILGKKFFISSNHSPLILSEISNEKLVKIVKDFLEILLKDKNIVGLQNFSLGYELDDKEEILKTFTQYEIKEWGSFLTKVEDKESLWNSFKSKIRYEVKKSMKQNLNIKEIISDEDIKNTLIIKNEARKNDNIVLMKLNEWNSNVLFYQKSNHFIPLIIKQDNNLVATAILSYDGNVMGWGGLAVSDYARNNRINAMHYLNWWAIEKANSLGLRYFDTVGYNPTNRSLREDGIYIFKKRLSNIDKKYYLLNYLKGIYKVLFKIAMIVKNRKS